MAIDSQSFSPPSSTAGILPIELMVRYFGSLRAAIGEMYRHVFRQSSVGLAPYPMIYRKT